MARQTHGAADGLGGVGGVAIHERDDRLFGAGGVSRAFDDAFQDVVGVEGGSDLAGEIVEQRQFRDGAV